MKPNEIRGSNSVTWHSPGQETSSSWCIKCLISLKLIKLKLRIHEKASVVAETQFKFLPLFICLQAVQRRTRWAARTRHPTTACWTISRARIPWAGPSSSGSTIRRPAVSSTHLANRPHSGGWTRSCRGWTWSGAVTRGAVSTATTTTTTSFTRISTVSPPSHPTPS